MAYITVQENLVAVQCYKCDVWFGMPNDMNERALKTGREFFCPNGHGQVYSDTEEKKLKRQLESAQNKLATAQFELMAAEKKVKRLEKRVKNGICPVCHRQFVSLAKHMEHQHPTFGDE